MKKVGKRAVLAYSKAKQSAMVEPMDCPKMTFKEVKRRSIISGLRVLRAPAVSWHCCSGDVSILDL